MNLVENENDYIDLRDFIKAIWKKRIFVIASTLFFLLVGIFFAFTTPNKYQSNVILSPLVEDSTGTSGLASRFGGLTSITGVSLPEQKVSKTTLGMEVMLSRKFFENFDKKYNILPDLVASKGWDINTNKVIYDNNLYDNENKKWVRSVSFPKMPKPSIQESYKFFLDSVQIEQNAETSLIILTVEHHSPHVAKNWADKLVFEINEEIKRQHISKAERSIEYLYDQINKTELSELRERLYDLVQFQSETIMLANASPEYVFQTIDPAVASEEKVSPNRILISILGLLIGLLLSSIVSVLLFFSNKKS